MIDEFFYKKNQPLQDSWTWTQDLGLANLFVLHIFALNLFLINNLSSAMAFYMQADSFNLIYLHWAWARNAH